MTWVEFSSEHPLVFCVLCALAFIWALSVFLLPFRINSWLKRNSDIVASIARVEGETKLSKNALEKNQDVMLLLIETIRAKNNKGKG